MLTLRALAERGDEQSWFWERGEAAVPDRAPSTSLWHSNTIQTDDVEFKYRLNLYIYIYFVSLCVPHELYMDYLKSSTIKPWIYAYYNSVCTNQCVENLLLDSLSAVMTAENVASLLEDIPNELNY